MNTLRTLLPPLVLAISVGVAFVTFANRKIPDRRPVPHAVTEVEVTPVTRESYTVMLSSRGTVSPRTESTLIPEVAGRILTLSPRMRTGAFFEAGDMLIEIDQRTYQADVEVARANLAQARTLLEEEEARAAQAERDWKRLGGNAKPDPLVLRKPQLANAQAAIAGTRARLAQAELVLERTRIRAPYAGRVLEQRVDVGQYVAPGTVLAQIYAVDYVEIRLPLTNRQLEFLDVPEIYRGDEVTSSAPGPRVLIHARIGRVTYEWEGRVVRAEGAIDTESRQLFVVAQVDDPYQRNAEGRPPLKVGQFVEASIEGHTLEDVIVIPRPALRASGEVFVIDDERRIRRRSVNLVWTDRERAVIADGLEAGERLVLTPVGAGMEGVEVQVRGEEPVTKGTEKHGIEGKVKRNETEHAS